MDIDLTTIQYVLLGAIALVSYMIGRERSKRHTNEVIEETIDMLISHRYIRTRIKDGEEVLLKIHEE